MPAEPAKSVRRLISNPQLQEMTGMSETLLYRVRMRGDLSYILISGRIYYDEDDVQEWLDRNRRVGSRFGEPEEPGQ